MRLSTTRSASSCMRSRRLGAALSSKSTSYQVSGICLAAASSASMARSAAFWASSNERHAATSTSCPTRKA